MSKPHFEEYDSKEQSHLISSLIGLLKWAQKHRPALLESPHELLSTYLNQAQVPAWVMMKTKDIQFIASCHQFLLDYAKKINRFPDEARYAPRWGTQMVTPDLRKYLENLIAELPDDHYSKKLDIDKLTSTQAKAYVDRLKHEVRKHAS